MLDAKSERAVAAMADELRALLGGELVAVALYGSAAGTDFVPGRSDVNVVLVVERVEYRHLRALRAASRRWRQQGIATPLVLDRAFLAAAVDVFPMELHDLEAQHRLIHGEDVFAALRVRDDHLRYQCEHEARGKLLRLRELYLELGESDVDLRALMLDSLKTFLIVMRHLGRLLGLPPPGSYEAVLGGFARTVTGGLPVMTELLRVKLAQAPWSGDGEETFRRYLAEVERLVQTIDRLPPAPGGAA
jgi:predicted nucleotidyltransferase